MFFPRNTGNRIRSKRNSGAASLSLRAVIMKRQFDFKASANRDTRDVTIALLSRTEIVLELKKIMSECLSETFTRVI